MGKRHVKTVSGPCPLHFQTPMGKDIIISFFPPVPWSKNSPLGGYDSLTIKVLAQKWGFRPILTPEWFVESVKMNGSTHGLIHSVILMLTLF